MYAGPSPLVVAIGSGLLSSPSTAAAIISVDPCRAGMASAAVDMIRQFDHVLDASVLGTILTSQFANNLSRDLRQDGLPAEVVDRVVSSAEAWGLGRFAPGRSRRPVCGGVRLSGL